ncbi:MAG: hypothetical protein QF544_06335 [Candidatus Thalassarchaeaceae archaeon]|nr:hypothetical protein [Candidatus Thalassarchaeaceae archaeon]
MSGSRARAISLTLLMVASLFIAYSPPVEATVISSDTHWSGNMTIDDNVLVTASRTLTISAGTNITVTGDYLITVDGTVLIEGTEAEPVIIINNNNPVGLNSNTGWWDGFLVTSGGNIDASWASISRGRTIFDVAGSATLANVTVDYSFIGADVGGVASITELSCAHVDFTCISVLQGGSVSASSVSVSDSAYGIENGGSISLDGFEVSNSGYPIAIYDGAMGSGQNLNFDNVSAAIMSRGVSSFTFNSMQVDDSGLLLDAIGSDGLVISNLSGEGIDSLIIGTNMVDVTVDNWVVNGSGASGWALAIDTTGSFTLENSEFNGFNKGFRLIGSGIHTINNSVMSFSGPMFDVSGNGRLHTLSTTLSTTAEFGHLSGVDSYWSGDNLNGGSSSDGLELVSGKHVFDSTTYARNYLYADSTSFGLGVTWATVEADGLILSGWSDGIQCRIDCLVSGTSLTTNLGGVASGSGINIDGGSVILSTLITGNSFNGIHLEDGDLHIGDWTGSGHGGATLLVDVDSTATVRNFPAYSSNGLWDAEGDGNLLFGGVNARIATASYDEFTESTISVSDLSSIPLVGVSVEAHGFKELTDSNGEATLPLLVGGSVVFADDGTYGVSDNFTPPGGNIQLPVIPSVGPWVIPVGVHAVLIGGNYTAPAGDNVTISTSSSLTLKNSHLSVPGGDIIVEGSGKLIGENGSTDAVVRTTGEHAIEGIGDGLVVMNDFHHGCSLEEHEWSGLHVDGDFYLEQTCRLNIYSGSVTGTIHPSMGGYFSLSNAAQIRVVDFGEPVAGATVTIQGKQVITNQNGIATFTATYRNVTEVSDSSTGILQVYVLRNGHSQIRSWDPISPVNLDIMMSSVSGGYLAEWLRLDATFSPYYLDDNLTIISGTTLTLLPYASLTVKVNRGIHVNGVLEATSATISGNDWNGITLAEGGLVDLASGQLMGGSLTLGPSSSQVSIEDMILSNAPLFVSGSGVLDISDSLLHQSDNCIFGNGGQVTVSDSTIQSCNQAGALLTQSTISFSNVTLGSGNEQGLHLRGASGLVTGVDGTNHDGSGPGLHIEMVDSSLQVTDSELSAGTNSPAISVEWSDMFTISNSIIHGAPGMFVDRSVLSMSEVDFLGNGSGVALDMRGARADPSQISYCDFDDYDNSVHLVGEEGDDEMATSVFTSNHHHATVAYASERLGFTSYGETIEGAVEIFGTKSITAEIWDPISIDTTQVNASGVASVLSGSVWLITVLGEASSVQTDATIEVTVPSFGDVVSEQTINADTSEGSASIPFIYYSWTESGAAGAYSATWRANAPTYMEGTGSFVPNQFSSRNITAQLVKNQAPVVNITQPAQNVEVQEGEAVEFNAVGQDLDSGTNDELTFVWYLRSQGDGAPGTQIFSGSSGVVDNIGQVGVYIVTVVVTDAWGSSAEDMLTINVILDDADNDFIETCATSGPNAWYDLEENRPCGPDVYDDDDDNDMIPDNRDIFPTDPCAHSDFDMDGLPNSLMPNCETDLIEDDDDDNDGTPDNADPNPLDPGISGVDSEGGGGLLSPSIILPIILLVVVLIFIFLRGSRDEFGGKEIY